MQGVSVLFPHSSIIYIYIYTYIYIYIYIYISACRSPPARPLDTSTHQSSYTSILSDIWLWVGVPWESSALVVPLPETQFLRSGCFGFESWTHFEIACGCFMKQFWVACVTPASEGRRGNSDARNCLSTRWSTRVSFPRKSAGSWSHSLFQNSPRINHVMQVDFWWKGSYSTVWWPPFCVD